MISKKTLQTVLVSAVALSVSGGVTAANADMGPDENSEKCFGVVKASANDCAAADKAHGCAGVATEDGNWAEWISLPKGVCERLVGGSLTPVEPPAEATVETPRNTSIAPAEIIAEPEDATTDIPEVLEAPEASE